MGRGLGAWIGVGPEKKRNSYWTTMIGEERARTPREERRPEKNSPKTHIQKMEFTASQSWRAVNIHDTSEIHLKNELHG